MLIFDPDGNELGTLLLSDSNHALLERDAEITVHFHTPQLLRFKLGEHNFSFSLRQRGDRVTAQDIEAVRKYIRLQHDIKEAMEEHDAGADSPR
jgi:hypothetical protein